MLGPPLRLVIGDGLLCLKHRKTGAMLADAAFSELQVAPLRVEMGDASSNPGLEVRFPNGRRLVVATLDPRFSTQHECQGPSGSTHRVGREAFIALVDALKPGAWLPEV